MRWNTVFRVSYYFQTQRNEWVQNWDFYQLALQLVEGAFVQPSASLSFILQSEFSVHTKLKEFKNAAITGHFGFMLAENSVREITWLSWRHRFRKALFSKCFPSTRKRKTGLFRFHQFEERFWKAPFSWRISVDGRPNRRDSNFSGVVRMLSWSGERKQKENRKQIIIYVLMGIHHM